ncbi:MAG: hypothetical protein KGL39_45275 [Patescibacteria group bacterium]|nr:hypothetical protein [Patescibacteria group bacterium]
MFVVIVGSRERNVEEDRDKVAELLNELHGKYPSLVVTSCGCDRGVGLWVKEFCMTRANRDRFRFVEISAKMYGVGLVRTQKAQIFMARNSMLVEMGEEFHVFNDTSGRRNAVSDLCSRLTNAGRGYITH